MSQRYPSDGVTDASPLAKPLEFEFSGKTAKNRFLKAAMTERLSSWDPVDVKSRGVPSKELVKVYERWGERNWGVILTGNIVVDYVHLEAQGNPIIALDNDFTGPRFEMYKELATAAKKHGSLLVGQVSHAGRQVNVRIHPNPVSASDVQLKGSVMGMEFGQPHAATQEEINTIVNEFAHAAEYLDKAGFDGIQLHGAHGYLLAQFLSPTTNLRTDKYGGSLENRARIITEIAAEIQKRVSPSFIVGIKINSVEFQDKGFTPKEAEALCQILEASRFDFVELSGGTYESLAFVHKRESTKKREAFFIEFAESIVKPLTKTKTYVTGGLRSVGAMVKALEVVDGVGLGKPATAEFGLPSSLLEGKVTSAVQPAIDESDMGTAVVAAGAQIRQVGKDQQPIDLTKEENVQAFFKDLGAWAQKMGADTEGKEYGFLDISGPAKPYVA